MLDKLWLIPLIPFAGFLLNGLFGKKIGNGLVTAVALAASGVTAIVSTLAVFQYLGAYPDHGRHLDRVYNWFTAGGVGADIAFQLDPLSIVMLMVVTWVSFLIHLYSVGYMEQEEGYPRYFAYLNLFLSAMLILVLGSSYLFIFVGWEGVGLCSYLLIGFYYDRGYAAAAGKKAFIVNRIGDFGFLIAMFLMFNYAGTVDFAGVQSMAAAGHLTPAIITAICLLLFLGACGKSAQIPLYIWLPDAMAGPTPVSALIHAATMVTAGVYLLVRSNLLYRMSPVAMMVVALIGGLTALFSATIAIAQNDIKKVLAYSTVSQLGFMFIGVGVGAFTAGIFHLVTHAFFKACLFLGAGSVIHAMGGEQDMRKMGGLRKKIPTTFWTFTVATIAISGIPPFAGFFSKDEILASAFATPYFPAVGKLVWLMGTLAAFFTAFYMVRLWYLTFTGDFRGTREQEHHLHESPWTMTVPLQVLAVLSIIGGFIGLPQMLHTPVSNLLEHWLHPVIPEIAGIGRLIEIPVGTEATVALVSTLLAAAAWYLARQRYRGQGLAPDLTTGQNHPALVRTLENKYYVDEAYEAAVVTPLRQLSIFSWKVIDAIIDGTLGLVGYTVAAIGDLLRFFQTGNVRNYALMLFGAVVIFIWVFA